MRDFKAYSQLYLDDLRKATRLLEPSALESAADILWSAYRANRTIYTLGNGGSATTASHFAADLSKGTLGHRADLVTKGFKAVSLSDNVALVTAWANDVGYEDIYSGQLARLAEQGDVVVAISASGDSPNVLAAVRRAAMTGATTIGLSGFGGGQLAVLCDLSVVVDSHDYGIVEDVHLAVTHILAQHLRDRLFEAVTFLRSSTVGVS